MKHYPPNHYEYITQNLILESAEVPYCPVRGHWIALEGVPLYTLEAATNYAKKLNYLITANQRK
jgi:hypothetical protein